MTDKHQEDKPSYETLKKWTRTPKPGTSTSSFAPHTPPIQRSISTFSSPGSILVKEEDVVIIELNPRYLRAGFEGESGPACNITFGPDTRLRLGDYRTWLPGYLRKEEDLESWGEHYELWRNDVKGLDHGLVSDVLERAVREAYNKHLLVDAGAGRLVLVLPSLVPHTVLETMLSTLFERWKYSTISLLPSPTMSAISAGVRSGLVVEIGWEETVITSVYECREIHSRRTTRAMKMLSRNFATILYNKRASLANSDSLRFDLDLVEEILSRAVATIDVDKQRAASGDNAAENDGAELAAPQQTVSEEFTSEKPLSEKSPSNEPRPVANYKRASNTIGEPEFEIQWPGTSSVQAVNISKQDVTSTLLQTFIDASSDTPLDDHESLIPQLLFDCLLSLPLDTRAECMSRIIIQGDSTIKTFVRQTILNRLSTIILNQGWNRVKDKSTKVRQNSERTAQPQSRSPDTKLTLPTRLAKTHAEAWLGEIYPRRTIQSSTKIPHLRGRLGPVDSIDVVENSAEQPPTRSGPPETPVDEDEIDERIYKKKAKASQPHVQGIVREVRSLGPWAGASLATSLKVRGFVEIERERFLSHRLAGATRDADISVASQQRVNTFGLPTTNKPADRLSWTLGVWG